MTKYLRTNISLKSPTTQYNVATHDILLLTCTKTKGGCLPTVLCGLLVKL